MNGPPRNRKERRALQAISGGKPGKTTVSPAQVLAPPTPAQRFGLALQEFITQYQRGHSGIDAMNITKVVMQYSVSSAIDFGAAKDDYLRACATVFDEEKKARGR